MYDVTREVLVSNAAQEALRLALSIRLRCDEGYTESMLSGGASLSTRIDWSAVTSSSVRGYLVVHFGFLFINMTMLGLPTVYGHGQH